MPFVKQECRDPGHMPCCVGDQCYLEYVKLMKSWKANPRWSTAHSLFRETFDVDDSQAAKTLAYLVFFSYHIMNYEKQKIQDNGDITGE